MVKKCISSHRLSFMENIDLNNLNNILIASNISTLTEIEVESFSSYTFDTQKSYFDF